MVTTMCNECGSVEHSLASMGSKCMFCKIGNMKLVEVYSPE